MAPVSLAIHAPGADLNPTVDSIRYLRDCLGNDLIRQYVTFHVFFSNKHIPGKVSVTSKNWFIIRNICQVARCFNKITRITHNYVAGIEETLWRNTVWK